MCIEKVKSSRKVTGHDIRTIRALMAEKKRVKEQLDEWKKVLEEVGFEERDGLRLERRTRRSVITEEALKYENWGDFFDISTLKVRKNKTVPDELLSVSEYTALKEY